MLVTRDAVVVAFRLLLGRDPADEAELAAYSDAQSIAELRQRIMATPAFAAALPAPAVLVPATAPPLDIEVAVDAETAVKLFRRVGETWSLLGEQRPHWSVSSRDEFLPERIGDTIEQFEATGVEKLAVLLACLARRGQHAERFKDVCDYGCGVGRVTIPLAQRFARVTACDISTFHLDIARRTAAQRGLRNIRFSLVTVGDFGMFAPFDLWFCQAVLQHNPPPVMAFILRRMFEMLAPGGVTVFQVPTYLVGYRFRAAEYLARPPATGSFELHVMPQDIVFALAAHSGCVPLEVWSDPTIWPPPVCTSSTFAFLKPG